MRYMNPETGLNLALVNFLLQCAATKSLDALSAMEIRADVLRDFVHMTGEDIARLAMVRDPLFRIEFDHETWQRVKPGVLRQATERDLRNALIVAGAPRAMIERWWPMRHTEFAMLRRMLGARSIGRTRAATEDEEHRLWEVWSEITAGRTLDAIRPRDYLELFKRTHIDLHVSWSVTNRWACEGHIARTTIKTGS